MNRFDEKYDIRFAQYEEIAEVMSYIDEHWKKNHILAVDRDFFEYEHVIDGKVTFLIAKNWETGEIEGILGYLPASSDKNKLDIWGVLWKTNDSAMPMLGIELKKRLKKYTEARSELGVGASPKTSVPLLKMILKYKVGKMKHFYILADCAEYKIAEVHQKNILRNFSRDTTQVVEYKDIAELEKEYDFSINGDDIPFKDKWYVERRYFDHPIYQYHICGLRSGNKVQALMIYREQVYNDSVAIRIVDYIGRHKPFKGLGLFLGKLLEKAEYIDFYCSGFETDFIKQAGFYELTDEDTNIIPDHFTPFECKNIDIYVDASCEGCMFFKADGDQDRPSI